MNILMHYTVRETQLHGIAVFSPIIYIVCVFTGKLSVAAVFEDVP